MKYISMKILPNGSMPVSGTNKDALVYHGPGGMGRGIWLTRQGKSFLPPICRPKSVPAITSGKLTNNHIAKIFSKADNGKAFDVV